MNLFLIFSIFFLCQIDSGYSQKEYTITKKDTTIVIKLLSEGRVILEEYPKQVRTEERNLVTTSLDGKKICGMQTSIYYESYGRYEIHGDELFLVFEDENPMEKIEIKPFSIKNDSSKTKVKITKPLNTLYDLKISQNNLQLFNILSFEESSIVSIEDVGKPIVLEYNGNRRTVEFLDEKDVELIVTIEELKGFNYRKNEKITFDLKQLDRNKK